MYCSIVNVALKVSKQNVALDGLYLKFKLWEISEFLLFKKREKKKKNVKKYLKVSLRKRIDNMVLEFVKNKLTNEEKKI